MNYFSGCPVNGLVRFSQGLAVAGLGGWMLVSEAAEMVERAEPPPPPPAVAVEWPAQLHYDAEMAYHPLNLYPGTIVASGAIASDYTWRAAIYPPPLLPQTTLIYSGGGVRWFTPLPSPPAFCSGGVIDQLTPKPFWPAFRSGQQYG